MRKTILTFAAVTLSVSTAYAQMSENEGMDHGNMANDQGDMPMDHNNMTAAQDDMPMDHDNMAMDDMMVEGSVHTMATINSFGEGTVNVSHDPIPAIGWPAMTMDMPLADDAQMMGDPDVGDSVVMMLSKGEDGMYAVQALMAED